MLNYTFRISFFMLLFSLIIKPVAAQNEAFHGGRGDGFGYAVSDAFKFSEVGFEGNNLSVTINQAVGQADPTDLAPITFTVVFSEIVTDFDENDVNFSSNADAQTIHVTGSGTTYTIELSNISSNGEIIVQIPVGSAHNSVGNPNLSSTSTDNSVTFTGLDLTLEINLATTQPALSNAAEVHFLVEFSESVSDFTSSDVELSGTSNANTLNVSGSGSKYDVSISGMTDDGTVVINVPANRAHNSLGKENRTSFNIRNKITCDFTKPTVEIIQAESQADPALTLPLNFYVEFNEEVEEFNTNRINFGGSVGVTLEVSGSGKSYNVAVHGVSSNETIAITIPEDMAHDIAGNYNTASINTDNSITYNGTTGIGDNKKSKDCLISYKEGRVYVVFNRPPASNSTITVYSIDGRLIYSKKYLNQLNSFPLNNINTLFIVHVINGNSLTNNLLAPSN